MTREEAIAVIAEFLSTSTDNEMPNACAAESVFGQMPITLCELGFQADVTLGELITFAAHDVFRRLTENV